MKAAIFGAGKAGRYLYDEIESKSQEIEIQGFLDNYITGEYKGKKIYRPEDFFNFQGDQIEAIFLAAGAQKTLGEMIRTCCLYGISELYRMHDIAGKCRLALFEHGKMNGRITKLKFSKQKPSLPYFEVPITDNCNLNCKGCLFASNMVQEIQYVNYVDLERDAKRMSELFYDVPWIRILGGEPLMHPDIVEILTSYRKYFPDAEVDLCTNGILLPNMKSDFYDCVKEEQISIHVSGYPPIYHLLDKIDKCLKEKNIPYVILPREKFVKYYTDKPNHDMEKSFAKCIASGCFEVYRGKLSTCSAAIAYEKFNQRFGTSYLIRENEDWFDIHNLEVDAWQLKKRLESPSYICKYCSDSKIEDFAWENSNGKAKLSDYLVSGD